MISIKYTVKKSNKARRIRLAVYCDGSVVVTIPNGIANRFVESFVKDKKDWILKKIEGFNDRENLLPAGLDKKHYKQFKKESATLIKNRLEYFNKIYKFKFNKVCIRDQKTRWGSCSRKGNLNFNYKMLFLPRYLVDFIIVHELCHLKELNHSKIFWALVGKCIPDYKKARKELKGRFGLR